MAQREVVGPVRVLVGPGARQADGDEPVGGEQQGVQAAEGAAGGDVADGAVTLRPWEALVLRRVTG